MPDHVFPEDQGTNSNLDFGEGDFNDSANFAAWMEHRNNRDYVSEGMEFSVDFGANALTISGGKAKVGDDSGYSSQASETRSYGVVYSVERDAVSGISLTDGADNYVYLNVLLTDDDAVEYVVNTTGSAPSEPSLLIGTVDTSADTYDDDVNRAPTMEAQQMSVIDEPTANDEVMRLADKYTDAEAADAAPIQNPLEGDIVDGSGNVVYDNSNNQIPEERIEGGTGGTYTAGHGLDLSSNEFSVDPTDLDGRGLVVHTGPELAIDKDGVTSFTLDTSDTYIWEGNHRFEGSTFFGPENDIHFNYNDTSDNFHFIRTLADSSDVFIFTFYKDSENRFKIWRPTEFADDIEDDAGNVIYDQSNNHIPKERVEGGSNTLTETTDHTILGDWDFQNHLEFGRDVTIRGGSMALRDGTSDGHAPTNFDYSHNLLWWADQRWTLSVNDSTGVSSIENLFRPGDQYVTLDMSSTVDPLEIEVTGFSVSTWNPGNWRSMLHTRQNLGYDDAEIEVQGNDGSWYSLKTWTSGNGTDGDARYTDRVGSVTGLDGNDPYTGIRLTLSNKSSTTGDDYMDHLGFYNVKTGPAWAGVYLTRGDVGSDADPQVMYTDLDLQSNGITAGTVDFSGDISDGSSNIVYDQSNNHIPQERVEKTSFDADQIDGYDVEKDGTDGTGTINFKTS